MKVEIELPEIEGYEYTGEYRVPDMGECALTIINNEFTHIEWKGRNLSVPCHILRKKRWRAEEYELYYKVVLGHRASVTRTTETFDLTDDALYESGNYFKTREEAEKALEEINAIFARS